MKNIYWVGNRSSDIIYNKNIFKGYICLYGNNNGVNEFSFPNVRKNNSVIDNSTNSFFESTINLVVSNDDNAYFLFYNPLLAHKIKSAHKNRFLCLNDYSLIRALDDKIECHEILKNKVSFAPYISLLGEDIASFYIKKILNTKCFVIQEPKSAAGMGTFIINKNYSKIKNMVFKTERYLISNYIEDSMTFNIHTIIDSNTEILFPPSYSIMEFKNNRVHYVGSSYIDATNVIGNSNLAYAKEMINNTIKLLRILNYKGIVGFDFLCHKSNVFLLELNLRFQGSSNVLNKMLKEAKLPSLFELNIQAFNDKLQTIDVSKIKTFYANIFEYYNCDIVELNDKTLVECFDDGITDYSVFENGSYLKRKIYKS